MRFLLARDAAIQILDVGAGYGALAQFLLEQFPNATVLCQDGSEEMAELGRPAHGQMERPV